MARFSPVPDPNDPSLRPDPNAGGSYYRRIEDINRALAALGVQRLPDVIKFLGYYFGCEKLARGIVGIHLRHPARHAYDHRQYLCLTKVEHAAVGLALSIPTDDLCYLFADFKDLAKLRALNPPHDKSARLLRNKVGHDLGPTNVKHVAKRAAFFIPKMTAFLGCISQVLAYQKVHFKL
jgi:hypothetical protein